MSKREARRAMELASIEGTTRLLKDVCTDPKSFEAQEALLHALRSQGSLARYRDADRGILPMSLNHFKAIANLSSARDDDLAEDVLSGFSRLDLLRREAANALAKGKEDATPPPSTTSKASLAARIKELEALALELREDAFLLQAAFDLRCRQARVYASRAGTAMVELCAREQREIDLTFSLCHRRLESGKVTSLQEARRAREEG